MPLHTIKDSVTGRSMVISNDSSNPLSESDIEGIFQKHDSAKEKIATDERAAHEALTPGQKFASSPIGTGLSEVLKPFDWHPYEGAKDVYSGVKNAIGGDPIGGATTALGGIGKIVTPPALATAAVAAPALTAAGLGLSKLSEKYPLHIPGQETVSPSAQKVGNLGEALGNVVMAGAPHAQAPPEVIPPPETTDISHELVNRPQLNAAPLPQNVQDIVNPSLRTALNPGNPPRIGQTIPTQIEPEYKSNAIQLPQELPQVEQPTLPGMEQQHPVPVDSNVAPVTGQSKLPFGGSSEMPQVTAPPEINNLADMKASEAAPTVLPHTNEPTPRDLRSEGIITPEKSNILNVPQESQNKIIQPTEITGTKVQQSKVPLEGDIPENTGATKVPAKPDTTPSNSLENIISDKYKHLSSDVLELLAKSNINDTTKQAIQTELDSRNAAPTPAKTEQPITEQSKTEQPPIETPTIVPEVPKAEPEESYIDMNKRMWDEKHSNGEPSGIFGEVQNPKVEQPQTNEIPQVTSPEPTTPQVNKPEETGTMKDYTQALDDMQPEHDIQMGRIAARKGIIAKVDPSVIEEHLVEHGISQDVAVKMVEAAAKKVKGERGFIRYNDPNYDPTLDKAKKQFSDVQKEDEPTVLGSLANTFKKTLQTTSNFLKNSPDENAQKIGTIVPASYDAERSWINRTKDQFRKPLEDLNQNDREQAMRIVDGQPEPIASPEVKQAAAQTRINLDNVMKFFEQRQEDMGIGFKKSGEKMGKLSDYFTHMYQNIPDNEDFMSGMKEYLKGNRGGPFEAIKEGWNPQGKHDEQVFDNSTKVGTPKYGAAEERVGKQQDINYDPNEVLGKYIEGMGRLAFRKPIIAHTQDLINNMQDSNWKKSALEYVKNYASQNENVDKGWNAITGPLMRANSRTLMLANPRLWALHAARMGPIFTELGTKYTLAGTKEVLGDLPNQINQAKLDGLVPGSDTGPHLFESTGQKINKFLGAYNVADAIPDAIARAGYRQKYIDDGYSSEQANKLAITKAKDVSYRIDPVRQSELFSKYFQGPLKPLGQYKQTQFKIAESYLSNSAKLIDSKLPISDRAALFGRMVTSTGLAVGLTTGLGVTFWHLRGSAFALAGAPAIEMPLKIAHDFYKGKVEDASAAFLAYITPAGTSIRSQIKKGEPSFFESEGKKSNSKSDIPSMPTMPEMPTVNAP